MTSRREVRAGVNPRKLALHATMMQHLYDGSA
jgi:hypothetical protein